MAWSLGEDAGGSLWQALQPEHDSGEQAQLHDPLGQYFARPALAFAMASACDWSGSPPWMPAAAHAWRWRAWRGRWGRRAEPGALQGRCRPALQVREQLVVVEPAGREVLRLVDQIGRQDREEVAAGLRRAELRDGCVGDRAHEPPRVDQDPLAVAAEADDAVSIVGVRRRCRRPRRSRRRKSASSRLRARCRSRAGRARRRS